PMLSHINVGTGTDVSILELAGMVAQAVGFTGTIKTDPTKPDGAPRKLLNIERLAGLGFRASIPLPEGLAATYRWYIENAADVRA
ncbi:MAG: GDP-L-fucose synthase, partial [Pseudomonadota bacterium]